MHLTTLLLCGLATLAGARDHRKIDKRSVSSGCVLTYDENCWTGANLGNAVMRFTLPYAHPPIGDLRFRPPRQYGVPTSSGPPVQRNPRPAVASELKSACPHNLGGPSGGSTNEDCLYINIYTPSTATAASNLPVYVYLHGTARSANDPGIDGKTLVPQGNVVVITVEYRQGVFGFFKPRGPRGRDGEVGNAGLLDVLAALRWTQNNIGFFGGDAKKVTLGGQSTGASIVKTLLAVPSADDYFSRAIMQSAPLNYNDLTFDQADKLADTVLSWAGCEDMICMRSLPVEDLLYTEQLAVQYLGLPSSPFYIQGINSGQTFIPFIDGDIVKDQATKLLNGQNGGLTRKDRKLLFSTVTNEAGLTIEQYDYVLGPLTASNYPATVSTLLAPPRNTTILRSGRYNLEAGETNSIPTLERLGTDYIWRCANQQVAVNSTQTQQATTYLAEFQTGFTYPTNQVSQLCQNLVCHEDDLFLTFGNTPSSAAANVKALQKEVVARWLGFIKSGNPNASGYVNWPTVSSASSLNILLLGSNNNGASTLGQRQEAPVCAPGGLWGNYVPFDVQLFG